MNRFAIYARKSVQSDKGESINIQLTKCRDYIRATKGDNVEFLEYEDEGYTGANTFRPDYQRLLRDIERGKIDVLVCYRLDRISRSVADFTDLNKKLEKHSVSFVSVNEAFDTKSPMGKAMMVILAAFAELERETIRERITDNMFGLAETDRWISGKAPLGYKLHRYKIEGSKKEQTKLVVDEETAPNVKSNFDKYIELRSMSRLETYLLQQYIKSQNGKDLSTPQLALILKNPTYVKADERIKDFYVRKGASFHGEINGERGLMTYGKTKSHITDEGKQGSTKNPTDKWIISVGTHPGIIEADVWLEAQKIMEENYDKFPQIQTSHTALVSGILRCAECGSIMQVSYGRKHKDGNKGYYYVCKMRKKSKGVRCSNENARADFVDQAVINDIKSKALDRDKILAEIKEQLKQGKQELARNPIDFIREDINKKQKQIDRLRLRVRETDHKELIADYENDIMNLRRDISSLMAELSVIGEKKTNVYQTESTLEFFERLLDKCDHIDELELDEQREFVNAIFKRITWNSETNGLAFEYITGDSNGDDAGGTDGNDEGNDCDDGSGGGYAPLESVVMGGDRVSHYSKSLGGVTGSHRGYIRRIHKPRRR